MESGLELLQLGDVVDAQLIGGTPCCQCSAPATVRAVTSVRRRGPVVEPVCQGCCDAIVEYRNYLAAADTPAEPGFFFVSECYNRDDGTTFFGTFTCRKKAEAYFRRAQDRAMMANTDLYPGVGVRDAESGEELDRLERLHSAEVEEELQNLVDSSSLYWEEIPDDDDDDDDDDFVDV